MRWTVALLALAACASPPPPMNPEEIARLTAEQSRPIPAEEMAARVQASQQMRARDAQAAVICRARGQVASSQPAFGGLGVAGGISAGFQQAWAGANAEAACIQAYQQTGIMPAL